jgi:hypothetical protein
MTPGRATEHELQPTIEELHARHQPMSAGQVATADGAVFETGDPERPFTIQTVSKPFTFGMAVEEFGAGTVAKYVGVEPSGTSSFAYVGPSFSLGMTSEASTGEVSRHSDNGPATYLIAAYSARAALTEGKSASASFHRASRS